MSLKESATIACNSPFQKSFLQIEIISLNTWIPSLKEARNSTVFNLNLFSTQPRNKLKKKDERVTYRYQQPSSQQVEHRIHTDQGKFTQIPENSIDDHPKEFTQITEDSHRATKKFHRRSPKRIHIDHGRFTQIHENPTDDHQRIHIATSN